MAPGAKRKRNDNRYGQEQSDSPNRPSPHRPQNLGLGQQQGSRRGSRSGTRGGPSNPNSPSVAHPPPSAMLPPPANVAQPSKLQLVPSVTNVPQPSPAEEKPVSTTVPESNQYITQARVSAWDQAARNSVVQAASAAQAENDMLTLSLVFEEIVQACLDRNLSPDILGAIVRDIVAAAAPDTLDPVSCFLDTVSSLTETKTDHAYLRQMLVATDIDVARMRSELESNLLIELELVRNTFSRVAIRKATHALYRQSNYNLLREEAEGYAKLMTEYFTTVQSEPPSQEVVNETLQRMNALIGAFDLDVGRVLDVTLDVFANLLVKHNKFFVKFLRSSPWWPELSVKDGIEWTEPLVSSLPGWALPQSDLWYYTDEEKVKQSQLREQRDREFWNGMENGEAAIRAFFELGSRRITNPSVLQQANQLDNADTAKLSEKEKMQKWSKEYMLLTETLPALGNLDAAQLLGFKLRFYASDARDAHDNLPDNLINLAALLIKIGFISLVDLYPHLYPEYTPERKKKLEDANREKKLKLSGKTENALTMASALPDEGPAQNVSLSRLRDSGSKSNSKPESERTTPTRTEDPKDKLPEPIDQKVALLRSLLCIGAIPEAMFILGRDPWLLDVYDDIHTYLFRLVHHALSKVYEWARPFPQQQAPFPPKQGPSTGATNQTLRTTDYPPRRTLRWAKLEEKDAGDGTDYRFYWEDWMDNVPVCQDVNDVFKLGDSLLAFIGLECGKDAVLLTKLARIGKKSLAEDTSSANKRRWVEFCSTFLCPALTFSGQNPGVVNEVWDLLKQFDTATRYAVYATWFTSIKPAVRAQFSDVTAQTKAILKRISAENTKPMGRAMAKLAYACPGIVFDLIIKGGQAYGNMVDALVEISRYLTFLGYDCLTWTMLKQLNGSRDTLQGDGMLKAAWLTNTSSFVGKAYKRYSLMDPTPVLEGVAHELMSGKGTMTMLPILNQLISSMAGILPSLNRKEEEILAIFAGPRLRALTLETRLRDQRHLCKGSAKRLMKYLQDSGKSQLAPVILLALALETQNYAYRPEVEDLPMKVLTANLDDLQAHFAQFLDFLQTNLSVSDFDATVPGVVELMSEYGIDTPLAFTIARPGISAKANAARVEHKKNVTRTEVDGDVLMGGSDEASETNVVATSNGSPIKEPVTPEDVEMRETPTGTDDATKVSPNGVTEPSPKPSVYSNPAIKAITVGLQNTMPKLYGKHPCLTFLVTFWQLSLVDMFSVTSMQEYKKATSTVIDKSRALGYDRRQEASAKREAFDAQIKALKEEADVMMATAGHTRTRLREEMHLWFEGIPMVDGRSDFLHETLLEECFLPRARLSYEDAQFASAMLKFMHKAGVPGFRTMKLLDQLFKPKSMVDRITICTPGESVHMARFLNDVLKELNLWHSTKDRFTTSAQGQEERLPGFGRTFHPDRTPGSFVSYDDYRHVLYKWHTQLFKALEECINSGDYIKIRNSINIIVAIAPSFPKVDTMGKNLFQALKKLSETETRRDLSLAAQSLLGTLRMNEKGWVSEQVFHAVRASTAQPATVARTDLQATPISSGSAVPNPPSAQEPVTAMLNATANSFNPRTGNANGVSNPPSQGNNTRENGEVNGVRRGIAAVQPDLRSATQPQNRNTDPNNRSPAQEARLTVGPPMHSSHSALSSGRPDSRGNLNHPNNPSRVPHALPSKPDTHPLRPPPSDRIADRTKNERPSGRPVERPIDRPLDRPAEYHPRGRVDPRGNQNSEYGRPDRDPARDSFPGRASPVRRERTRSPDRGLNPPDRRDFRDRDYNDRSMPPPRDAPRTAGRGPGWEHPRDPRDTRDMRDPRDTRDHRGDHRDSRDVRERGPPLPPLADNRNRMHGSPAVPADDTSSYRRDFPPKLHQNGDRGNNTPSRPSIERPSPVQPPMLDRGAPASMINPERAALINNDGGRNENFRNDREARRDRVLSPRRGDDRAPAPLNGRGDTGRDHRDDRTPPQPFPANRDRREEPIGGAPTGPRSGRPDTSSTGRLSREIFTQPSRQPAQDPNYGRLNPPAEPAPSVPSGPRSLTADRRDSQAHPPAPLPPPPAPPTIQSTGMHPSRMANIRGAPSIQTDVPGAPSGPRNLARTPQGSAASPSSRSFPTGPASTERPSRSQDNRNPLRTINTLLTQNAPAGPDRSNDWNTPNQSPQVRGRGANRASGLDEPTMPVSTGSQSHPSTPNAFRPEGQHTRSDKIEQTSGRLEGHPQDEGRLDSRGHREGRRSERSGHNRSRSQERNDRRPEERSGRPDDQEKMSDRERGSGREKRSSDRDSSRRDRDRDGDRTRDGRERRDRASGRVEELGSRRGPPSAGDHRSGDARGRGGNDRKDDRDRRSGRDDGRERKRGRGPEDASHGGDTKRSRPST
ncbi:hypothetical protein K504DRAFT_446053 [Pleomassaria siparia CBS 279.74]|uniref:THO complex subunit 2 n=1 Tax=Pleomassaria siparia CBS 279.74 TaxID=1314801 RepID=A0A6G1KQP4_9PLEO|nr:hypothetical protein K504DRAFT_446053 [Pleomassaria siparia CBS 279.74]